MLDRQAAKAQKITIIMLMILRAHLRLVAEAEEVEETGDDQVERCVICIAHAPPETRKRAVLRQQHGGRRNPSFKFVSCNYRAGTI